MFSSSARRISKYFCLFLSFVGFLFSNKQRGSNMQASNVLCVLLDGNNNEVIWFRIQVQFICLECLMWLLVNGYYGNIQIGMINCIDMSDDRDKSAEIGQSDNTSRYSAWKMVGFIGNIPILVTYISNYLFILAWCLLCVFGQRG